MLVRLRKVRGWVCAVVLASGLAACGGFQGSDRRQVLAAYRFELAREGYQLRCVKEARFGSRIRVPVCKPVPVKAAAFEPLVRLAAARDAFRHDSEVRDFVADIVEDNVTAWEEICPP